MSKFEIKQIKLISCISIVIIIICLCMNSISYAATTLSDAYDKVKKSKSQKKWEIVYAEDGGNGTGADWFDSKGWYLIIYEDWTNDADQATKVFKYVKTKSSKKIGENVYDLCAANTDSGHYDISLDKCGDKGEIQKAKVPTTAYLKDKSKIYTIDNYSELDATGKKSMDEAVENEKKPETAKTTVIDKSAVKPEWGNPVSTKFTYNNDGKYYDKYIDSDGNIWLVPNGEEVSTQDEIYQEDTSSEDTASDDTTSSDLTFSSEDKKTIYKGNESLLEMGGKIFGVVQFVCYAVAFAMVTIKGLQFAKAAPEEKADIKKELIYVAVGGAILFAIGSIVKIIGTIAQKTF